MTPAGQPDQLSLALQLRDASSFASFVAGPNGPLLSAARQLANDGGQLYVWSATGQGRSHLLEAAARVVNERGGQALVLAGDMLAAMPPAVLEGLEAYDLVAIDDIDRLAGLAQWEESLFHLYNHLRQRNAAWLCSAGAPPAEAGFRLPDLASRLAAGPVFRIQPLSDEELGDLLSQRARARGLALGGELVRYVVTRCGRRPADLMAALEQLDKAGLQARRKLTIPFVRQVLGW